MSTERVTISLPTEVRHAAADVAKASGRSFSAVVGDAMAAWMRTRLVDAWLDDHQQEFGEFDEAEQMELARDAGVPYSAPRRNDHAA